MLKALLTAGAHAALSFLRPVQIVQYGSLCRIPEAFAQGSAILWITA